MVSAVPSKIALMFNHQQCLMCFVDGMDAEMETVLGEIEVELDGRFCNVRKTETNLGMIFYLYD